MITLYWLAICIGGVVAYVGIAGLVYRVIPKREYRIYDGCDCVSCDPTKKASAFWPLVLPARLVFTLAKLIVRPLRSVWRLTSGEIKNAPHNHE